jgi:hypothetical protein
VARHRDEGKAYCLTSTRLSRSVAGVVTLAVVEHLRSDGVDIHHD